MGIGKKERSTMKRGRMEKGTIGVGKLVKGKTQRDRIAWACLR